MSCQKLSFRKDLNAPSYLATICGTSADCQSVFPHPLKHFNLKSVTFELCPFFLAYFNYEACPSVAD